MASVQNFDIISGKYKVQILYIIESGGVQFGIFFFQRNFP
jgi:hypothetical protein